MSLHPLHGLALATAMGVVAAGVAGWAGHLSPALVIGGSGAAIGGLAGLAGLGSSRPGLRWFGPCVTHGRRDGAVALTFDDGPSAVSTGPVLEALDRAGARASFFVLADRVVQNPGLLNEIVAAGHEVGLHGLSHHPWLTVRSPARGADELRRAIDVLQAAGAPRPRWFRPPFGVVSPQLCEAARLADLEIAWCSLRIGDGVRLDDEVLLARCRRAVSRDVVLLHEGDRPTWRLLPQILRGWTEAGLEITSLGDALVARS